MEIIFTSFISGLFSQNLVLNPSFEDVNMIFKNKIGAIDYPFYAKSWLVPTDGTPDIYRDVTACNDNFIKNYENDMDTCIDVYSGNYCIALILMNEYGYVEHLTGKLIEPLEENQLYKAGFYAKSYPGKNRGSGLGVKLSIDSIPFSSDVIHDYKISPFYSDLFKNYKVKSDYEINQTDTLWCKYEFVFKASGGEKFITLGKFSEPHDHNIINIMKSIKKWPVHVIRKKLKSNEIPYFKPNLNKIYNQFDDIAGDYYFIDSIFVSELGQEESKTALLSCQNCIDNNPMTIHIPKEISFNVDKGFFGNLDLSVHAFLTPNEKVIINLGNKERLEFLNSSTVHQEFSYSFKYPSKKIKGKKIYYHIAKKDASQTLNYIGPLNANMEIDLFTNIKKFNQ